MKGAPAALAVFIVLTMPAIALADVHGWDGPGWYVSGGAPLASGPFAAPVWILFKGPYALQSECIDIYDRLYAPIGRCRLLEAKPGSFGG